MNKVPKMNKFLSIWCKCLAYCGVLWPL